jgi:hypothetical protein
LIKTFDQFKSDIIGKSKYSEKCAGGKVHDTPNILSCFVCDMKTINFYQKIFGNLHLVQFLALKLRS